MACLRHGITILFILGNLVGVVSAQTKQPRTLSELVAYSGADREKILIAGAKAEGKVTWYTSLAGSSYKELAQGFEKKYGVKVDVYRAASNDLMARITAEAKARQYLVDTIETTLPLLKSLREDGLLAVYTSPHLQKYPAQAKEKAGNGLYYWGVNRESFIGVGYNPNAIPAGAVPKNFAGLLNPQLKGKMGMTTSDTGVRMMGAILKFKGDAFASKLKAQDVSLHSVSGRAMADSGDLRRSADLTVDLSRSCHGVKAQRRAHRLGGDGRCADQCRRHCDRLSSASSPCRSAYGGFHSQPGRTENSRRLAVRQPVERLWLQALVSRGGVEYGSVRPGSD